eukprot:CAMPEP_0206611142 /NCGR_PEP_ID=MMETSP0325_2-20121206/55055_1 /ASSEMBLY_ACC=CAM_ASM_000347 /TAXON_ID=2866 /ORGANISM="Crypthecodinium cohnii, Strain Seligo" /LENGTH=74 /DNA_ID=CAMNT_0054130261 /DNA_START=138 /DNA_END=362 /DNA_ORIENTATION=-
MALLPRMYSDLLKADQQRFLLLNVMRKGSGNGNLPPRIDANSLSSSPYPLRAPVGSLAGAGALTSVSSGSLSTL